jgi:cytochrome P450
MVVTRFLHAMFIFPEIAQKVYEELAGLTGGDRLPAITDRHDLPYTEAVWKESLRWRPASPIGTSVSAYSRHCS